MTDIHKYTGTIAQLAQSMTSTNIQVFTAIDDNSTRLDPVPLHHLCPGQEHQNQNHHSNVQDDDDG